MCLPAQMKCSDNIFVIPVCLLHCPPKIGARAVVTSVIEIKTSFVSINVTSRASQQCIKLKQRPPTGILMELKDVIKR